MPRLHPIHVTGYKYTGRATCIRLQVDTTCTRARIEMHVARMQVVSTCIQTQVARPGYYSVLYGVNAALDAATACQHITQ